MVRDDPDLCAPRSAPCGKTLPSCPSAPCQAPPCRRRRSLDGDVHLSHYALGLASRPLPKLSLRGNATYDGRDDQTTPLDDRVHRDRHLSRRHRRSPRAMARTGCVSTAAPTTHSVRWVRLGVGGELQEIHYSPGQVVTHAQDAESWGRASITPLALIELHTENRQRTTQDLTVRC